MRLLLGLGELEDLEVVRNVELFKEHADFPVFSRSWLLVLHLLKLDALFILEGEMEEQEIHTTGLEHPNDPRL